MSCRLAPTVVLACLISGAAHAQTSGAAAGQTVELVEIAARKKPQTEGAQMFGQEGLELKFVAVVPGKKLLSIDKKASTLTAFTDDAGTDLAAGADKGFFFWASMQGSFGGPKESASITIRTKTLPTAKAGRVKLQAKVVLMAASNTKTAEQKIQLKKGAKVTAGPVPMEISSFKNGQIQFQSSQKLDAIQKIEFMDGSGKPIQSQSMGSGSFGFGNKMTYSKSFSLSGNHDQAKLKITYFADLAPVEVPIDVDVGLGL